MKFCLICKGVETNKWYSGPTCRVCYSKKRYLDNKQAILSAQDPEKKRQNARARYKRKKTELLAQNKLYYQANRESLIASQKDYYRINKISLLAQQNIRERKRMKTDVNFMIRRRLRSRLRVAMKSNYKSGLAVKSLGCSVDEFRMHIESLFCPNMTWENYGKEWELDHKKPLFKFDLTVHEEMKQAGHFSNLQPLWKKDHYLKSMRDKKNEITHPL